MRYMTDMFYIINAFATIWIQDLCKRLLGSKGVLDKMSLDLDFEREVLNAFILLSISDVNLKLQVFYYTYGFFT